ncbi:Retaining alpha-galactosidase [Flavobacterium akiainvivens]|uniref:Retaining alpha-galactosidase n=1 Tax=Flavobacterium akiainvivens TaxID=1202724 RepID=A0A0M8MG80_9FLAO|nr:glycoside hydrolase family 97 protein [Flavobacterium akiainvivens]KOS05611.1 Retaining alpha-galactosidase [Flavobacterium akiainvivens]SFQ35338.1 alpha-glucosidase [Flavobacterium akiainvivens]
MKKILLLLCLAFGWAAFAQKSNDYKLASPDGKLQVGISVTDKITWTVSHGSDVVLAQSPMSLTLEGGEVLGKSATVKSAKTAQVNTTFATPLYKKKQVQDYYNSLVLTFKNNFSIEYRAYNDGVAYRFITARKKDITVKSEEAVFNFTADHNTFVPYVRDLRNPKDMLISSFEALYENQKVSAFKKDTLAFLPFLVEVSPKKKAVFLEAGLEHYPGLFVSQNGGNSFKGVFAGYPLEEVNGGFHDINMLVTKRADYLVKTKGTRSFPWRIVVVAENDKDLANNDMVQKLSDPSKIKDVSWIKPGKVAWDWWNDWNIYGVDFKAGINTATYKYYIDFASANKVEYVVLDEGWSIENNIMEHNPDVNLTELIAYAKQRNVGIILWASWMAVHEKTDEIFKHYADMGVKGFKVDFIDRDDAKMVQSIYTIAEKAANHKLLIDYHGMYKPTGIQRTWPNILNFEGVKGMENNKWTPDDDVPTYDCTIPFIRMMAGPMDYTPGAMDNTTKKQFRSVGSKPKSQGTRCHQLALYTIFEAPLQMMADSPTAYKKEQESTDFIAKIPTVFDETVALDGSVGNYVSVARKKGSNWYLGAITNWTARDITIDFSFLEKGKTYKAEIFKDGVNADKAAVDYRRETVTVTSSTKLTFHLAEGGGVAAVIVPQN